MGPLHPTNAGEFDRIEVPAAYAVVVEHLRRAIHLGTYAPGDRLPPERVLAPQLGVSRVTLRGAMRVLEGEGYLTVRRGATGGAVVRTPDASRDELRRRLRSELDELLGILEFRKVNERLAAERAATRATAEDIGRLQASVDELRASSSIGEFRAADSSFHLQVASAAASRLLFDAVTEARAAMFLPLDALGYEISLQSAVRDHEKVIAAIQARDPARAGRAMATHIKHTNDELLAILAEA